MHESLRTKKVVLPSAGNTQQDLFDHRVIAHEVTESVLCDCHALKARGMMMIESPAAKVRKTYRQEWHEYNLAQTNEKARLQTLLYELCQGIEEPIQTFGRPRLPFADMIFAAVFKVYSTVSGRRFISDLREAHQRGYLSKTPHFNSISNYLELESMTPYLKQLISESSLPLKAIESDFAVDSSGFAKGQFLRWFDAKYGTEMKQHDWLKVHVMCGVKTNVVTSVEVSGAHANDTTFLKPLLETTTRNGFQVKEVSADKGYDSFKNRCLVLVKGGVPYIPFREGEKNKPNPSGKGELWKRMYHFYKFNETEFKQHYHKRSNVETVFSMIKAKFGERLRSKTETAQVNEVLCKVLCHNLCCVIQSIYEFGLEATFCAE
jgi:transposase